MVDILELNKIHDSDKKITSIAINPHNETEFISVGFDKQPKLWDSKSGKLLFTFNMQKLGILKVRYLLSGNNFVTTGFDNLVTVWDPNFKDPLFTLNGHTNDTTDAVSTIDGKYIISGSLDGSVRIWNIKERKIEFKLGHFGNQVTAISIAKENDIFATGDEKGTIYLWNIKTRKFIYKLKGHKSAITCISFTSNGDLLMSGSKDTEIKIWDIKERKQCHAFLGHDKAITAVKISTEGKWGVSASLDGSVRVYDIESRRFKGIFNGLIIGNPQNQVYTADMGSTGEQIVVAAKDKTIRILYNSLVLKEIENMEKGLADLIEKLRINTFIELSTISKTLQIDEDISFQLLNDFMNKNPETGDYDKLAKVYIKKIPRLIDVEFEKLIPTFKPKIPYKLNNIAEILKADNNLVEELIIDFTMKNDGYDYNSIAKFLIYDGLSIDTPTNSSIGNKNIEPGVRSMASKFKCKSMDYARWHFENLSKLVRRFIAAMAIEDKPDERSSDNYIKITQTFRNLDQKNTLKIFIEVTFKDFIILSRLTFSGGTIKDAKTIQVLLSQAYDEEITLRGATIEISNCLGCGASIDLNESDNNIVVCSACGTKQKYPKTDIKEL